MKFRFFIICILSLFLTSSCVSRKSIAYFQELDKLQTDNLQNNLKIQPDDVLTIRVSSPQQEAALPFNLTKSVMALNPAGASANVELETYLVADDGTITFPVLGKVKAEGFSNLEFADKLEEELLAYVKNPLVNVRILNFKITVLGEVGAPGTFSIEDDHLSLPQALGLAGDVKLTGKRKNVLIVRKQNNNTTYAYLDLTDADIINSPFYNLMQDDVVYVEPIGSKIQSASYLGTASGYLSVASVLISLIFLFAK